MASPRHLNPSNDVPENIRSYLRARWGDRADLEAERIADAVKRTTQRGGDDAKALYNAISFGISTYGIGLRERQDFNETRRAFRVRDALVKHARRLKVEDDVIAEMSDLLSPFSPELLAANTALEGYYTQPQKRGRPWGHRMLLDTSLAYLGMQDGDRQDVLEALDFVDPTKK